MRTRWVKRFVKPLEYKREFAGKPGYWALRRDEKRGGLFVVFGYAANDPELPEGLEELEDWEQTIIEKKVANMSGWWDS